MSSYLARKAASKKAEGMLAPLLESDEESSAASSRSSDDGSEESMEAVKQTPMQKLKSLVGERKNDAVSLTENISSPYKFVCSYRNS